MNPIPVPTVLEPEDLDVDALRRLVRASDPVTLTLQWPTHRVAAQRRLDDAVGRQVVQTARSVAERHTSLDGSVILRHLDIALEAVDPTRYYDGIVIWVGPRTITIGLTTTPLPSRVTLGTIPAVLDVMGGLLALPRSWMLALSEDRARLVRVVGEHLAEVVDAIWPHDTVLPPGRVMRPRAFGQVTDRIHDDLRHQILAEVDRLVVDSCGSDDAPLVVLGPARDLQTFRQVTAMNDRIVGWVEGNHDRSTIADLGVVMTSSRHDRQRHHREDLVAALDRSRSADRVLDDVADIAQMARAGLVERFVVWRSPQDPPSNGLTDLDRIAAEVLRSRGDVDVLDAPTNSPIPGPLGVLRMPVGSVPPVPATPVGPTRGATSPR